MNWSKEGLQFLSNFGFIRVEIDSFLDSIFIVVFFKKDAFANGYKISYKNKGSHPNQESKDPMRTSPMLLDPEAPRAWPPIQLHIAAYRL